MSAENTSSEVPPVETPKSMSVCFNLVKIRRIGTFSEPSSCVQANSVTKDEHYSKCLQEMIAMPMKELLKRTLSFSDITSHITYVDPTSHVKTTVFKNDTQQFDKYLAEHVQTYFKGDTKCFEVDAVLGAVESK